MTAPILLAAIDLDGTLLGTSNEVSEANARALRRLADAGVLVAAATARWHASAIRPFEQAGVSAAVISSAGADVRLASGEVVAQWPIAEPAVTFLGALCERNRWSATLARDGRVYRYGPDVPDWAPRAPAWMDVLTSFAGVPLDGVLSAIVTCPEDEARAELAGWSADLQHTGALTIEGGYLLTVTARGVDKGAGLRVLCERLGIDAADTVAFGDSDVDLPMFAVAGQAVAMGNATPEVLAAATLTAPPAAEDGFAAAVERLLA